MMDDSIVNITDAQARLNKLVDQDSFAISRHGKIVGVYLSRERIEALVETMELLSDSQFPKALKEYESERTKLYDAAELDREMSR